MLYPITNKVKTGFRNVWKNWIITLVLEYKYLEPLQRLKWINYCMCILAVNRTEHVITYMKKHVTLICRNIWYWMGKEVNTGWFEPRWLPKSLTWRGFVHFSLSVKEQKTVEDVIQCLPIKLCPGACLANAVNLRIFKESSLVVQH